MAMPPAPPLPPGMAGSTGAPAPQPPSMMQLAGMGNSAGTPATSPGMSQISESVVRMSAEIDQALKLLAQALPQLAPWVEQVTMQLKTQIGTALQSGSVPTSPVPQDNDRFPDGGARL